MNNPPAFPRHMTIYGHNTKAQSEGYGMTLRDYFAAKAMQSLVLKFNDDSLDWNAYEEADIAYQIADAMLAAREKA